MRKSLLATTAIVGVSMLGVAAAEAASPMVGDNLEVQLRGYSRFEALYVDQDFTNGRAHSLLFELDDSEIVFDVNNTADNGLKYGFKVEWDTDANAIDENRLRFSGDWGILDLGADDGAEDTIGYGGENLMTGIGGYDGGSGSGFNFLDAAFTGPNLGGGGGDTGDANKITYYTPRMGGSSEGKGFRAGASYTPDTGNTFAVTIDADDPGQLRNVIGAGIDLVEKFGEVDFRIHGIGAWGNVDSDPSDTIEDASGYMIGLGLGWTQWKLALGYGDGGDGLQTTTSGVDNGDWISSSIQWADGPYTVALGYLMREQDLGTNDVEVDFYTLGANYVFAPGLRFYAELDWIDVKNPAATTTDATTSALVTDNDGFVFAIGTNIAF